MSEDTILDHGDAADVGYKVVEMADKVRKMEPMAPGVEASWVFTVDGLDFEVRVKVAK